MLINFDLLIGGSMSTAVPLILSVPAALLVGVVLATVRRRRVAAAPVPVPAPAAGLAADVPSA